MGEILALTALAAAGVLVLAPLHRSLPRLALAAMAFPVGATAYAVVAALAAVVVGRVEPGPTLAVTMLIGAGCLVVGVVAGRVTTELVVPGLAIVGGFAVLAGVFWSIHLTRLTIDSMRYLLVSVELQMPDGVAVVQPADLLKRQLALPSWQAMASFTDRRYVAGLGPLFGLSGMVFLGWLVWAKSALEPLRRRRFLVAAAVGFALASNRLLYDWFYVNTHIEMAVLMLMAVAGLWLATVDAKPAWAVPAGLSLAGMLMLRPESPLLVALVLAAFASVLRGWTTRLLAIVPSLVVLVAWHALTLWHHAPGGSDVAFDAPVFSGLVAVVGSSLVVVAGGSARSATIGRWARDAVVPVLALALVAYTVVDPSTTVDSVVATARNVGYQGLWGLAWTVGFPVLLVTLLVQRIPLGRAWATVVVGYGLLFFLLPHARGSPWRLGSGDSGNRILAHVFLVVVAFMVLAAIERIRPPEPAEVGSGP